MPGILPHLVCAALYAAAAVLLYRSLAGGDRPGRELGALHWATLPPLLLHTWLLYRMVFHPDGIYLGVGTSVSVIIWLTVAIYWLGSFVYRLHGLQVLILGAAAGLVLLPALLPSVHPLSHTNLAAFRLHLLISLLAYSLFTIASLQALMMAVLERRLHGGALPAYLQSLPPLLTLERLLFRIITAGFLLLTLTLASGMLFSEALLGRPLPFTHKVIFGILAWLIYAALLAGRRLYGWRGRTALRWTLGGFLALVLAYIGSKFVLEVILQR
ncbi:MAG TPA: cytochrome c biogenesis protein CcsA [Burkholderiales bacterium]|jgi:ABC-type uncharacterized transport system permease subunit